jgi:hypothetical protein
MIMAIIGTVLSLPAYFLFFTGNTKDLGDVKGFFNAFTLGNLGYCNIFILILKLSIQLIMHATMAK